MTEQERKQATELEAKRFEQAYLWLEENMPAAFFQEVDPEWVLLIVHSLMDFKTQSYFATIALKKGAIALCLDSAASDVYILQRFQMYGIKSYKTYISKTPFELSSFLRVAILEFTSSNQVQESLDSKEILSYLRAKYPFISEARGRALFERMDKKFLRKMPLDRQAAALAMLERAESRDHCQYEVVYNEKWQEEKTNSMNLILAWKNVPKHNFLHRLARVVYNHGLVMRSVNATYIDPYTTKSVFLLSFDLHGQKGNAAWDEASIADFLQEITSLKYFGSADLFDKTFVETRLLSGNKGNLLRAMMNFIHQMLVHVDPYLYTLETIVEALCRHPDLTIHIVNAFEWRLHPERADLTKFEAEKKEIYSLIRTLDTGYEGLDRRRKNVLLQAMNFIEHCLKTNFYRANKTSLVFRLDPKYLDKVPFDRKTIFPELPYGIFFFKGMHYVGFHVRFKDLSRGGLRTVVPERKERVLVEGNTVFSECYNLAYTQHKKNKDIPEGGSKGVIFLKPDERIEEEIVILAWELDLEGVSKEEIARRIEEFKIEQKREYLYQTQRSYIKNFLSLINCDADGRLRANNIIDYYHKPEYIYLGPDENMHDVMINWIAAESQKEHYKPGGSFISGKPETGINHKQYGVTSLGVNVFMQEMLLFNGIDPQKDSFTLKMTGGPDGDVAGNMIHNLYTYMRKTAKLLALTDVSGTIFDPKGLDLSSLLELFKSEKPIRFYPTAKLSAEGFLLDKETRREVSQYVFQTRCFRNGREEWLSGNEMNALYRHNVHRTKVDVFLPCGGRPRTLREDNIEEFLDESGKPTAKLIVEGANLYFSHGARRLLEEKGALIVQDSSANKCGVICSSYEVLSGLTLKEGEFLEHKERLVAEILKRLERCARDEALVLLQTHRRTNQYLTEISEQISKRINYFTDELLEYLEPLELSEDPQDPLVRCFLAYVLPFLREEFQSRLMKEIPENHKKAIIASHIASRLVYKEGLDWSPSIIDILPLILTSPHLTN